jgi:transcriptional regulator with XRE-family HTH domain
MESVRRIRKERGLSQQALSELAGINKVTLVHIETGKSSPNVDTLEKLARALDVEVADFFPKVEPSLFSPEVISPEQGRREPTPVERHAIETLKDYCDRLEEFLSTAERTKLPHTLWIMEADTAINMAALSLPLAERDSLRPLLVPVAARLVDLAHKVFEGARSAGAVLAEDDRSNVIDAVERFAKAS